MRIKHKANVRVAEDADMKNILFGFDDALAEVLIDNYLTVASGKFSIDPADTEELSLGDITACKGIYLHVFGDAEVTLNDAADSIQMHRAGVAVTDKAKLFVEAVITKVTVTAPADATITGVYCAWGDPAV
jgi:hypothetical protein